MNCVFCKSEWVPTGHHGIVTCNCQVKFHCTLCNKRGYEYNILTQHRLSPTHMTRLAATQVAAGNLINLEGVIAEVIAPPVVAQAPVVAAAAAAPAVEPNHLEGEIVHLERENLLIALRRDNENLKTELAESQLKAERAQRRLAKFRAPEKVETLSGSSESETDEDFVDVSDVSSEDPGVDDPQPPPKKAKQTIFLHGLPPNPAAGRRKYLMPKHGGHRRPGGTPPPQAK
jgi:hypothetical protein